MRYIDIEKRDKERYNPDRENTRDVKDLTRYLQTGMLRPDKDIYFVCRRRAAPCLPMTKLTRGPRDKLLHVFKTGGEVCVWREGAVDGMLI